MNARRVLVDREQRSRRGRGQALVEFAMILPAFLLVLAGILDFGFLLNSRVSVINAVREATRWAVVQTDVTKIPANSTSTGLTESAGKIGSLAGVQWSTLKSSGCAVSDPSVNCRIQLFCTHGPPPAFDDCDFAPGGKPDAVKGDSIQVRATYYYSSFFASLFGQKIEMSARDQGVLQVPTP